jgi:hypothetical protein
MGWGQLLRCVNSDFGERHRTRAAVVYFFQGISARRKIALAGCMRCVTPKETDSGYPHEDGVVQLTDVRPPRYGCGMLLVRWRQVRNLFFAPAVLFSEGLLIGSDRTLVIARTAQGGVQVGKAAREYRSRL